MKRPLLAAIAVLALCVPAQAQLPQGIQEIPLAADYDLDQAGGATFMYCVTRGVYDQALSLPRAGYGKITTSGSSTTVTGVSAAQDVFDQLAVGDIINVNLSRGTSSTAPVGGLQRRVITAKASADSVTVNAVIDLTDGVNFGWRELVCGTTAAFGWFPVHGIKTGLVQVQIDQLNATGGITYQVECKLDGPTSLASIIAGPTNKTAVFSGIAAEWDEPWDYCRVGMMIVTADDGADTGADAEKITITYAGRLH